MRSIKFVAPASFFLIFFCCTTSSSVVEIDVSKQISIHVEKTQSEAFLNNDLARDTVDVLENRMDYIFQNSSSAGISAAVYIPNKGIWKSARYMKHTSYNNKIDTSTMFHAGSVAKLFCAAIIFKLIENIQLSLDDKIAQWFPDFPKGKLISIEQLLNHTSGIVSFETTEEYHREKAYTPDKLIEICGRYDLLFTPGTAVFYSNTGYVMLGLIAERITGLRYDEIVKKEIIDVLNLENTRVITAAGNSALDISGHDQGKIITPNEIYSNPFSAGNIASTPKDLVIFLHAFYGGKLISFDNLNLMHKKMNAVAIQPPEVYFGKGVVVIKNTPIGDFYGHSGIFPGFYTALFYSLKFNAFICVMMNDNKIPADACMFLLAKSIENTK